jgi:hypothetical protein
MAAQVAQVGSVELGPATVSAWPSSMGSGEATVPKDAGCPNTGIPQSAKVPRE